MSHRNYAVGWNDCQCAFADLMGRNENAEDYCDRLVKAVRDSIKSKRDMYRIGALNCISWYQKHKKIPPRLSWKDKHEPWNNIEGEIPAKRMRHEVLTQSIDETEKQLEGIFQ